jgi:hypothetical protein
MGKIQQYLNKHFGFPVQSEDRLVALNAATATQICVNNPDRVELIILNLSATNCAVGLTSAVTVAAGIMLAANGGQLSFMIPDDGDLPGRALWAIATAGNPNIYIIEMAGFTP